MPLITMDGTLAAKHSIIHWLEQIGVKKGDHLAVGVSLKSIGPIDGGPDTFIEALINTVGPEGTVMMNTHTRFFTATEIRLGWVNYIFDAQSTPCITGVVAEKFRLRKEALRSRHPTCSIAAIGKQAHFLTDGHDESADAYLPYRKLAEIGGKYLAIGIGDKLAGFRHRAQQEAHLLEAVPWKRAVIYRHENGGLKTFIFRDRGGCTLRLPELVGKLRAQGLVTDGRFGQANAVLVPSRESLERMTMMLKENPAANLCKSLLCYWCRELERRMNLYGCIDNPRIFQKSRPVICLVALMNRVRELDNGFVMKAKLLLRARQKKWKIV